MQPLALALLLVGLLTSCASPPPAALPLSVPQAKLRVAVDTSTSTNVDLWRAKEKKCGTSSLGHLGFFNPGVSSDWQKSKRKYGLRQGIAVAPTVPEHMYSEHVVALDNPMYVRFNAVQTGCAGAIELPLSPGNEYEFVLSERDGYCRLQLFSLDLQAPPGFQRREIGLQPAVTGALCRL